MTPEAYWEKVDELAESAPSAPVSTSIPIVNDADLTKATADLKSEKEAHGKTKGDLTKATADLKAHQSAVENAGKLLKSLIPKKIEDLKKLTEKQLASIVKTYEVKTDGLEGDAVLQAISDAVHG